MENHKFRRLLEILKSMKSALLAYSGGVDSTLLLKAMQVSDIKAFAVTASSEIIPQRDVAAAQQMAGEMGIAHRILKTDELSIEEFVSNSPERCFFCKDELFKKLEAIALSEGYEFILDGSIVDDTVDHRPGRRAAMKYRIRSPLIEGRFSKKEIRELSRQFGLSTWDKPSSPCLATRFPYNQRITKEALRRVETAENFLRSLGLREIRVRDHGCVARIEVSEEEIDLILGRERRKIISETLKSFGYTFTSLDLDGYHTGSMNRILFSSANPPRRKHNSKAYGKRSVPE
jgi:uncharacterized protein